MPAPRGQKGGSRRVEIARLPGAQDLALPAPSTPGAAGLDLPAAVDGEVVIEPGARALIPTGFAIAVPPGLEGQVRPRSGLALHYGIVLPNAPGTIDSDYRGEVKVILLNTGHESFVVKRGERIAQLVFAPVERIAWHEVKALGPTARGRGGRGHSGRAGMAAARTRPKAAQRRGPS